MTLKSLYRNADHAKEDVVPACQVVLKNLKLDYLDLFLVHSPSSLKKGTVMTAMTDDNKLGYDGERMSQTWQVSTSIHCMCAAAGRTCMGHI